MSKDMARGAKPQNRLMSEPAPPQVLPLHPIEGACPFCNETFGQVWRDVGREEFGHQVRCGFCDARGPWSDAGGAVEAWHSVRPVLYDEG